MEINELKEILIAQRELYVFLSNVITSGPQKELLNRFICTYRDTLHDEAPESDDLIQGIITMKGALDNDSSDFDVESLVNEYTRLFIGPGKIPVPPYASFYLSKEPQPKLMDENTIEVRKQYLKDNIVMANLNAVPDDYLGAELEYMTYLTNGSIESIQKQDTKELHQFLESQMNFIRNHLLPWIPKFSLDLISSTREDFFKGFALLLRGIIMSHYCILKEMP